HGDRERRGPTEGHRRGRGGLGDREVAGAAGHRDGGRARGRGGAGVRRVVAGVVVVGRAAVRGRGCGRGERGRGGLARSEAPGAPREGGLARARVGRRGPGPGATGGPGGEGEPGREGGTERDAGRGRSRIRAVGHGDRERRG